MRTNLTRTISFSLVKYLVPLLLGWMAGYFMSDLRVFNTKVRHNLVNSDDEIIGKNWISIAEALMKNGDYNQAFRILEQGNKYYPDMIYPYQLMAICCVNEGDENEAEKWLIKAVEKARKASAQELDEAQLLLQGYRANQYHKKFFSEKGVVKDVHLLPSSTNEMRAWDFGIMPEEAAVMVQQDSVEEKSSENDATSVVDTALDEHAR